MRTFTVVVKAVAVLALLSAGAADAAASGSGFTTGSAGAASTSNQKYTASRKMQRTCCSAPVPSVWMALRPPCSASPQLKLLGPH